MIFFPIEEVNVCVNQPIQELLLYVRPIIRVFINIKLKIIIYERIKKSNNINLLRIYTVRACGMI